LRALLIIDLFIKACKPEETDFTAVNKHFLNETQRRKSDYQKRPYIFLYDDCPEKFSPSVFVITE
jgi:hypothetical protein